MLWFMSDPHFGHPPIIEFCQRPFLDLQDMREKLLYNINSLVKPTDLLYILGDFSFMHKDRNVEIIKAIKCPVVLIKGNHDHSNRIKGVPFADIYDELDIILGNHVITMSHFPYWIDNMLGHEIEGSGTMPDRYKDKRPKDNGLWLLHGHTHDKGKIRREYRMIHVGVDAWNYAPINEIDILNLINDK